ncbi:MAG: substrate-binding domain-containing protein [Pseudomonadota bacterium]
MKRLLLILGVVWLLSGMLPGSAMAQDKVIKMSTTTSTQDSGLLDVLLPAFKADTGIEVKVIAKGTGAAIADGRDGNVDVIFVHDLDREKEFVAEGYGTKRYAVMHNDFIIIGPKEDPAGVKKVKTAAEALKAIVAAKALFVSRGDDSGTHGKEQSLWDKTGLPLETTTRTIVTGGKEKKLTFKRPGGDWYLSIGQGMGKVLTLADEKKAYTLTDRGTYISFTSGKTKPIDLVILREGDPDLFNLYGVIPVNPKKHAHVKFELAKTFAEWLVSKKGQGVIANYKLEGKQLFFPDAIPDAK